MIMLIYKHRDKKGYAIMKIKIKIIYITGIVLWLSFAAATEIFAQAVWLDQLDLTAATQGYGTPGKNKTIDGRRFSIGGKTFERGFGTHAESFLAIKLD